MKRSKRFTLRRIILGLAIVAIAAPVAQAKPIPATKPDKVVIDQSSSLRLGPGEVPYMDKTSVTLGPGEIPSVDDGTPAPTRQAEPVAAVDDGYDLRFGLVSSAVIVLLLAAGGSVIAIRHSRKAKLSPA
jgi:hypothetical protein